MNTTVGQAGEYLVAALLIDLGLQVMVSPTDGCDLLAFDADKYWRVEVKTSSQKEKRGGAHYRFGVARGSKVKKYLSRETCDIVAMCALPLRKTIFRHVEQIKVLNVRVSEDEYCDGCEQKTWKAATAWTS